MLVGKDWPYTHISGCFTVSHMPPFIYREIVLIQPSGIITCALRFSVFFTTPLFSDPTWYASGGPMIYALVEPSIYMIASILPTTRHLYRRAHRKVRELRGLKHSPESPNHLSDLSRSGDMEDREKSDKCSREIMRHVDIRQSHNSSSQEELTLGKWYQSRHPWN